MLLTKEERSAIEIISAHFDKIDYLYSSLDLSTKDKILDYHNETGSLPHCIRWGVQACEDLLEENDKKGA